MSHAAAAGIVNVEVRQIRTGPYDWGKGKESSSEGDRSPKKGVRIDPYVQPNQAPREDYDSEINDALSVVSDSFTIGQQKRYSLRKRINQLFDDPESSTAAMYTSMWFMLLIILSTLAFMMETLPYLSAEEGYGDPDRATFWFGLEATFVTFFTFEYVVRWVTSDECCRFPIRMFNMVDLLAIAPFYIEIALSATGVGGGGTDLRFVRVVRLARVFRVLKMGKKFDGSTMLIGVFTDSFGSLVPPFFFLLLGMIFFSSLIYICEQGTYDKDDGRFYVTNVLGHRVESTFVSIPEAMWWAVVTMTTVGYGDMYPHTALGRMVCSGAMIFGVLFSAMPIAVIGNHFTVRWQEERMKMNAAKEFRRNAQINNTSNWGPAQLRFFCITMRDAAWTRSEHFFQPPRNGLEEELTDLDGTRAMSQHSGEEVPINVPDDPDAENPERYVSRRLSHELIADRNAIESQLPEEQRILAYKLHHITRAESSKCEHNIETYTLDFASELYHLLGFGAYDKNTNVHLGFRSKAGLVVQFGEGKRKKEIKSDSDLGVFTIKAKKRRSGPDRGPSYYLASQCKTTTSQENYGRIAGELLATAQQAYLQQVGARKESRRVFLVSFRGFHLTFYSAYFSPEYLETIARGKKPSEEVTIGYYPPRRSMSFPQSTIMGTFDFLTPSQRNCALKVLLRIKRLMAHYAGGGESNVSRRRSTLRPHGHGSLEGGSLLHGQKPSSFRKITTRQTSGGSGGGAPAAPHASAGRGFDVARLKGKGDGKVIRKKSA
eukprot:TRINITY_DN55893_c0_g1_i1.p1 TRINITY_DN55893_c0_g1~~TRINITY_DN55893_c0_g1_i1.p1  ORF type:complete len:771 (+),score=229.70 TRINITY_DN55893_c0_g1_i1:79-2391(+)